MYTNGHGVRKFFGSNCSYFATIRALDNHFKNRSEHRPYLFARYVGRLFYRSSHSCPDVHYFNSSRRLNLASAAVTSKDAYLGRPMRSYLTGAKEFVGNLNAVQMDIFQTVMNSEHVDANGIRL